MNENNHKEPSEAEYALWEERVINDIENAENKLKELKTLLQLVFDRCVILDQEGQVDYELSTNLWLSNCVNADDPLGNTSPQIDIVSTAKNGGIKSLIVTEFVKKKPATGGFVSDPCIKIGGSCHPLCEESRASKNGTQEAV